MESKFGLLRCIEVQKTRFTTQQQRGDANTWWANYIPTGVMRKKRQEFMDLKQGGRSVHDYSKQFNHLTQYTSDQVNMKDKKKDRFMIGLSTKLQECMTLNTGGTFLEFVSNVMIVNEAICAHKETKKRKVVAASSGSAPLKYRTVYHPSSTYPPRQPQRQQHQWQQ
jgi:hypothetical protein